MEGLLSVVIPAMNEEENIPAVAGAVRCAMESADIPYEIIFVDDGSTDLTWAAIEAAAEEDARVRGLRFSRNFGKEGAMFAGLHATRGDCAAVLDADMQFPPETVCEMYALWRDGGCAVVEGRKRARQKESLKSRIFAKGFYRVLKSMSGIDLDNCSDFRLLDRRVVEQLRQMPERQTLFRALSGWMGYKTGVVEFDVAERAAGETKFSTRALVKLALSSIASFTSAPLQIVTGVGIAFVAFAVLLGIYTLVMKIVSDSPAGYTTLILLMLLTGGVIMISLGIIGFYIARIYEEIKFRPRYIISEEIDRMKEV